MTIARNRFALMPALLFGRRRRGRLDSKGRRRMHRARARPASLRSTRTSRSAWPGGTRTSHHRLAGTDRSTIKRLTRHGTAGRRPCRHSGTRRGRSLLTRNRTRLLQAGEHGRIGRNDWTGRGLSRQVRTNLRAQRHVRRRRKVGAGALLRRRGRRSGCGRRSRWRRRGPRWGRPGLPRRNDYVRRRRRGGMSRRCTGSRRSRRRGRTNQRPRQWLTRAGENLARLRSSWDGPRRNGR